MSNSAPATREPFSLRRHLVTTCLCLVLAVGAGLQFLLWSESDVLRAFGLNARLVFSRGDVGRALLSPVLHPSVFHAALAVATVALSGAVEAKMGRLKTATLLVATWVIAAGLQMAATTQTTMGGLALGLSLVTARCVVALRDDDRIGQSIGVALLAFAGAGAVAHNDVAVGSAGLIAGVAVGVLLTFGLTSSRVLQSLAAALVTSVLVIALAASSVGRQPGPRFANAIAQAEVALAKGDPVRAQEFVDAAFLAIPNAPKALILQARLRYSRGELDPALADLRAAWRLSPSSEAPYRFAEAMLGGAGRKTEQRHVVDLWRKAAPASAAALAAKSRLERQAGDLIKAKTSAERSATRAPTATLPLLALAQVRFQLGDANGAKTLVEKVVDKEPLQHRHLAFIALARGDVLSAQRLYAKAAATFPAAKARLLPFQALANVASAKTSD